MLPLARFRFVPFVAASLAIAAAAQAQRPLPHPLERSPEWTAAVAAGTRTADGRPGPANWHDTIHYRIDAELDPTLARVQGHVVATYTNGSPEPLGELWLHLRQNLHAPDAVRNTRVQVTGGMQIERVQVGGAPATTHVDGTRLHVPLERPLGPGEHVAVAMDFAFVVPAGEAPRMGHDGNSLFFVGYWYPQFAVRDAVRGFVCEPYLGESEFYMPFADYEVALRLPEGWLATATGTLQNPQDVLSDAVRERLAKAAESTTTVAIVDRALRSAGPVTRSDPSGTLVWRFAASHVRDFAFATCDRWLWDAAAANVGDRDGDGTDNRCLVQSFHRRRTAAWRRSASFAQHAIERMSQWLLPYPWPHATVVEGILGGGMEYPMLTLCGDQHAAPFQQSLIAHELIHMWFPMLVGSDETAFGWQDEGLTDFFTERLERDHQRRGDDAPRPSSSMRGYLGYVAAGLDREPMLRHADHLQYGASYGFLCYTKPAAVLDQLARWLGEEKVTGALRDYARTWRHDHPTPEDFFASMNRSLGQDLDWYWSTWWTTTWQLDHAIAEVTNGADGALVTIVDQGRAPHPTFVRVHFADGTHDHADVPVTTWLGGAVRATLRFARPVTKVELDPDHRTLDVDRSDNTWSAP